MNRETEFKGIYKDTDNLWIYGQLTKGYTHSTNYSEKGYSIKRYDRDIEGFLEDEVVPDSIGEYTGLKDKNGNKIYEGDIVKLKYVKQNYQTHRGENIPHGSYTEPDTSTIEEDNYSIIFENGAFRIGGLYDSPSYTDLLYDIIGDWYDDVFINMDDDYFEEDGFETLAELRATLGLEVIGNIYTTPELLK